MALLRRSRSSHAYSKIDNEDPEERKHRLAQFLIQKVLLQADSRRRPSLLRIRIFRLKVKIGRRLKKLRKSMLLGISAARVGAHKRVISHVKTWRRLFHRGETINVSLPSVFTWWSLCFCFFFLLGLSWMNTLASGGCYCFIMPWHGWTSFVWSLLEARAKWSYI